MNQNRLDLYTDYLSVTFGYATATGLSKMLDGQISHDAITRFLSEREYTSQDLWRQVKQFIREVEQEEGVMIIDDTVQEKPHMDENDLICWHFDHCEGRSVKGINLLNCLYHVNDISIPVAFELIRKPVSYSDLKTKKEKRHSEVTKNEQTRKMLSVCVNNKIKFSWVLADCWFASNENMKHIKQTLQKDFIMALKCNRLVALSEEDRKTNSYIQINQLDWSEEQTVKVWLKGIDFPVLIARQVFTNKDGSNGVVYLACSKLDQGWKQITTIYQKRWKVEVFHKSLKSNAAFAKSPAHTVRTQANHLFASIVTVFKMECLAVRKNMNHFALKSKLYIKAIRAAFDELQAFRATAA